MHLLNTGEVFDLTTELHKHHWEGCEDCRNLVERLSRHLSSFPMTSFPTPPPPISLDNALRQFAIELHQLAWSMPSGHEYQLLGLSKRMLMRANLESQRISLESNASD